MVREAVPQPKERSQPRNVPGPVIGSCERDADAEIGEGCQRCLLRNADNRRIMVAVKLGCQKRARRIDRKPRKTLIRATVTRLSGVQMS